MNVFAQRLNRLQCGYFTLLKLHTTGYLERTIAPTKRKFDGLMCLRVQHAVRTYNQSRGFVTRVNHRIIKDDRFDKRIFLDRIKENDYAHNWLLQSTHYAQSVMHQNIAYSYVTNEEVLEILEKKWDDKRLMTSEEILSMLKKLSYNIRCSNKKINEDMYRNFFEMLGKQCKQLSDDSLKLMMQHLIPFYKIFNLHCDFYETFYNKLNKECMTRFTQLKINEMLLLCDMMYQIMPMYKSDYIWYAMRKLGNKPNKLNRYQLVQILFFLNICRKSPINMYELEYRLEQCLDELTINELAISLLGFFKTGTQIRSASLLRRIMRKTMANIESVDSISIAAIMKLLRYSMQLTEISLLQELLRSLIPYIPRYRLMSLTHIAHICAKVSLDEQELMDKISLRLNSELKTARLKDIERLIYVFANFNLNNNNIGENVVNELRTTWNTSRAKEISLFPEVTSRILGYLAVLGIYPVDLIKRIMSPEFVSKTCKNNFNFLTREYCVLDYSLRLEVPDYDGPFLKSSICNMLEKKYFQEFYDTLADNSRMKLFLTEVKQTCQEMFYSTSDISIIRPLPHYATPDIIFCVDKWNKLMPTEKFLSQFNQGEIMRIDKTNSKDVTWFALILAHFGLLTRNSNSPIGHLAARIRQLSIIGYTPILLSYIQWNECRTPEQKYDYIRKRILEESKLFKT